MFGAPILSIWYWCTDQFIVQRVLSAKNISHARAGSLFAGYLKQLPLFIFVIPGVLAFGLAGSGLLDLDLNNPDKALPILISEVLPSGIKGLVLAGLLAALMSSLSSAFNSCSTLFTIDFYKKFKPNANERELVWVGQLATVILVIISLMYIPLMKVLTEGRGIIQYMQSVQAYISPPIAAAFLLGLFVPRINATGAMVSLWTGFVIGGARLICEFLLKEGQVVNGQFPIIDALVEVNFLHFALYLFLFSVLMLFFFSVLTPPPPKSKLQGVTFTTTESNFFEARPKEVLWSVGLVVLVLIIWFVFSEIGIA